MEDLLNKAIAIAEKAHRGQVDKGGHSYIGHPIRVMDSLETEEEKIVGILHDAIEDSDLTIDELRANQFSDRIIDALDAITKRPGEKVKHYLKRVMQNFLALKVKIADLTDNLDISRIPNPTDRDLKRTEMYRKTLVKLQNHLSRL